MVLQEAELRGMDQIDLVQDMGQVSGACECYTESTSSIKCGGFLDYLKTYYCVRKGSAPRSQLVYEIIQHDGRMIYGK